MGKDSDLLEAARTGDVDTIEKILSGQRKAKVSLGPFSSLRKGPNPSCQDTSGDTPLHHAALHGHKEAVQSLLRYEASANIPDSQGCYPLHLAAWSGNAEICKILITHGPSIAQLDEQNNEGDTALHCAAQYGHTSVVAVLIEHQADTTIRNKKRRESFGPCRLVWPFRCSSVTDQDQSKFTRAKSRKSLAFTFGFTEWTPTSSADIAR